MSSLYEAMHYPVLPKYKVTQGFGENKYADVEGTEMSKIYEAFGGKHPGLDFGLPIGEPVFSALPGRVTSIEYHRGMGKTIRIRYGNIQIIYAHLSRFLVDFGEKVKEGQRIALSGGTVHWSEPHLHFETRDRTREKLKDRPFEPDFSRDNPEQFTENWEFTTNDEYALIDLSIKFFGCEEGVQLLREHNQEFTKLHSHEKLPVGTKVMIPY